MWQLLNENGDVEKHGERVGVTHPCDGHPSALCMCKGACDCHQEKKS
jgi:hypothetical protein